MGPIENKHDDQQILYRKMDKPMQGLSLNNRINNLIESLTKGDQKLFQVEVFFNREQNEINGSFGDKELQERLINLSAVINEKFNNPEAHELAFQIQCTAQALRPHFELSQLPSDVQQIIFYQYGAGTTDFKDLSKDFGSQNSITAKKGWINGNHISLKKVGCNNAKEAVQYIIEHKLISANLSEFSDLTDEDLQKLCENCPYLESLSINSQDIQDCVVFEKLTNLQSLNVNGCSNLSGKFVEALEKLTKLQILNVSFCTKLPEKKFAGALENLTNLQSLDVSGCNQLEEAFVEALENLTNLLSLNVSYCKEIDMTFVIVLANLINLQSLAVRGCTQFPEKEFMEALANLINLQSLDVSGCNQLEEAFVGALVNLTNLQSLSVSSCDQLKGEFVVVLANLINLRSLNVRDCTQLPGKEFVQVLAKLTNLESLDVSLCTQLPGKEFIEVFEYLINLQSLDVILFDHLLVSSIRSEFPHLKITN